MAQDYIEYEFTKKNGQRVYEMVSRESSAQEMLAFQTMHDAVSARPASENPLRLAMQAVLDELTDAATHMEGEREETAAGIRLSLQDTLVAGDQLERAKGVATQMLVGGFHNDIRPATWFRLRDAIERESNLELHALRTQVGEWSQALRHLLALADAATRSKVGGDEFTPASIARTIRSAMQGWDTPNTPRDGLREALEALFCGKLTRNHSQRILEAIDEAELTDPAG